jgi:hypothetical protein
MIWVVGFGIVSVITGILIFFGCWYYSCQEAGFFGFLVGWIPSMIAAYLLGIIIGALWPLIILGALMREGFRRS